MIKLSSSVCSVVSKLVFLCLFLLTELLFHKNLNGYTYVFDISVPQLNVSPKSEVRLFSFWYLGKYDSSSIIFGTSRQLHHISFSFFWGITLLVINLPTYTLNLHNTVFLAFLHFASFFQENISDIMNFSFAFLWILLAASSSNTASNS